MLDLENNFDFPISDSLLALHYLTLFNQFYLTFNFVLQGGESPEGR